MSVIPVSPEALAAVNTLVAQYGPERALEIATIQAGYERLPPTIEQFIADPYYLGGIFKGGQRLFPVWHAALAEIFPTPLFSPYAEIIMTGAIGTGKSTLGLIGMLYDACRLLHLRDPVQHYGNLLESTTLAFALINATMKLADSVLVQQFNDWLNSSPFFRQQLRQATKGHLLPKNVTVMYGSRFTHTLGMAVVGALLSELNFQIHVAKQAYSNYTSVRRRLHSRFTAVWSLPGRLWLDSSHADELAFLEEHIEKARSSTRTRVYDYALWEVKKPNVLYSGQTFPVYLGTATEDPRILTIPSADAETRQAALGTLPADKILWVPEEHYEDFADDLTNAIRDIGGKKTRGNSRLIPSVEKLEQALVGPIVLTKELVITNLTDAGPLIEYVPAAMIAAWARVQIPRMIHIDLGISGDNTGFGMSRFERWRVLKLPDPDNPLRSYQTEEPCFVTELVMPVKAAAGGRVPIEKVKQLVVDLQVRGVPIRRVTTDGYQSEQLRQDLLMYGVETGLLSVDATGVPYETLSHLIMSERWVGPAHPLLRQELENLLRIGTKVNHPPKGSKDLGDAAAGSVYAALDGIKDQVRERVTLATLTSLAHPTSHNMYEQIAAASRRSGRRY